MNILECVNELIRIMDERGKVEPQKLKSGKEVNYPFDPGNPVNCQLATGYSDTEENILNDISLLEHENAIS